MADQIPAAEPVGGWVLRAVNTVRLNGAEYAPGAILPEAQMNEVVTAGLLRQGAAVCVSAG